MKLAGEFALAYAEHSETSVSNAGYERPAMQRLIADPQGLDVLDVGCGGGALLAWLREKGARAVGLDISADLARVASARGGAALVGDMRSLPFADRSFDLVTCSLALHYLADWSLALSGISRVLRPSGSFILSVHHPSWDWPQLDAKDYYKEGWIEREFEFPRARQKVTVKFHRKTMSRIINALGEHFVILEALEPTPQKWTELVDPMRYNHMLTKPKFILFRAVPVGPFQVGAPRSRTANVRDDTRPTAGPRRGP